MTLHALFPTLVYTAPLQRAGARALNRELLKETRQIREHDADGRRWSARRYPGGYTSYGSLCHLNRMSSTFATLEQRLRRHLAAYVRSLQLDMTGRSLVMTDCWVNVMGRQVTHGLHLHPLATVSGTYYVQTPPGCSGLKLEDPRLDRFMGAPPRRAGARQELQPWVTIPARAGQVVLFESWLRHEVPPNTSARERVSISFNYNWY
ncbi:MAG: phytanoyl-CoA dioxygenase family protein [Gammaproteobacteria bacterium]|nr:phytanoyl-CoA dioxygenase family protein [Gammaproteobacteria bacterium]